MNAKKTILGLLLPAIVSLVLFAGCKSHHHHKGSFALDYLTEALDLTMEQEAQLEGIRDELITEAKTLHEDKKEILEALKVELAGDTMNKEILRNLVDEHRTKMDGIIHLAIDRLTDFHSGLSPEQKEKLLAKLDKFEKYHCKRFSD